MAVEDTQAIWREYRQTRDQKVRDRLILTYAPLVKYVAGRLGSGLPAHVDEGDPDTIDDALERSQQGKGYGEDEGEREEALPE